MRNGDGGNQAAGSNPVVIPAKAGIQMLYISAASVKSTG